MIAIRSHDMVSLFIDTTCMFESLFELALSKAVPNSDLDPGCHTIVPCYFLFNLVVGAVSARVFDKVE